MQRFASPSSKSSSVVAAGLHQPPETEPYCGLTQPREAATKLTAIAPSAGANGKASLFGTCRLYRAGRVTVKASVRSAGCAEARRSFANRLLFRKYFSILPLAPIQSIGAYPNLN